MSLDLTQEPSVAAGSENQVSDAAALDAYSSVVTSVAAQIMPSVVSIRVEHEPDGRGARGGGGSVIVPTPDGFLLTSSHVTEGSRPTTIQFATGEEIRAEVVGSDRHSDLSVVRCAASGLTPALLGDAGSLQVGQLVVAVGSPLGYSGR